MPKRKSNTLIPNDAKKSKPSSKQPRLTIADVTNLDFSCDAKDKNGNSHNLKISSWNVNGVRAWNEKNGHSFITAEDPDIFCLQETKCDSKNIPENVKLAGYTTYWLSGDKDGYSGTGLYTKIKPINVTYGIGHQKHDNEGRVITAEYESFFLITAYVPNSGRGLPRLKYRTEEWDVDFRNYIKDLDSKKPIILCGDLNVAHMEIDLANPKTNHKTAGFTKEERECFSKLLEEGFVDSFRHIHPSQTAAYTYWTYIGNARAKNIGWRLDYFLVSERLRDSICENAIRDKVEGSDHCPITLFLHAPSNKTLQI